MRKQVNPQGRLDIIASQNRLEELLLDLIYQRVLIEKPLKASELGEQATERYEGYEEGWWDCFEVLRQVIVSHNEDNEHRQ